MKTPPRRFVVEVKSGRRQPKAQTNSIWGDTDFKALAREVEDKAPHLFNSDEAPRMPDEGRETLPDLIRPGPVNQPAGDLDVGQAPMPPRAEADVQRQNGDDQLAVEAVAQVHETQPVSLPRKKSKGTSRKRTKRAPAPTATPDAMIAHEGQDAQSRTGGDSISFEGLATLEAENRRLKRQLAERLHQENLQLKMMLERFAVATELVSGD